VKPVLLLAGTAEARALASAFDHPKARMVASLAGVTARPLAYACETRVGGFGGVDGLRAYLARERIAAIIDATHPFAAGISRNAVAAAGAIPLLSLVRPAWPLPPNGLSFATLDDAVAALPSGARVLATTGRKNTWGVFARDDLTIFLRSVDPVENAPAHVTPLSARGPFSVEGEASLMRAHRITHVLTRNAGGDSRARLDSATMLGLRVHLVERPPNPAANVAHTVADALRWLRSVLGD